MLGRLVILLMTCLVALPAAMAQATSLSATMNVHVFPREGQDEVQQSMDEAECYTWAADRTGTDPFELSRQAAEQMAASEQAMAQAQSAGQGSTGRAAAGGAVTGALIGGVFGSSSQKQRLEGRGRRCGHRRGRWQFPQAQSASRREPTGRRRVGPDPGCQPGTNGRLQDRIHHLSRGQGLHRQILA